MTYGLICEYNPFHEGHKWQLEQIRAHDKDAKIICVMSGNFVQRGEPAIWNKWERARAALQNGADMVLELPTIFSTAPGPDFARASIQVICATGIVDTLVYGVEDATLGGQLPELASLMHTQQEHYEHLLRTLLQKHPDESFARVRLKALEALVNAETPHLLSLVKSLDQPNLILGLEYELALLSCDAEFRPTTHPLARNNKFPTASQIRAEMTKKPQNGMHFCVQYSDALNYALTQHSFESLLNISGMNDALAHRILDAARDYPSWDELLARLNCKTWPTARLRRLLLYILLNITEEEKSLQGFDEGPRDIHILGVRDQALISQLAKSARLPLRQQVDPYEARYTDIYAASPNSGLQKGAEYTQGLIKL